ncbi:hypothetical protein C8R45DRAFT_834097 [Mycena sanguinolenta]|nr:hypothetical protein C8R45DRAFT_834097 [Mycena sanguinolenta]
MLNPLTLLAFCALAYIPGCISAPSNRTIDDYYGDSVTGALPTYGPSISEWNVNNNCTTCFVQPDIAQMVNHSWHDTTHERTTLFIIAVSSYSGTAIYFFGVVPNTVPNSITVANLTFSLDGAFAGSYTRIPDSTTSIFLYSVPMLALADLSNTTHTLIAEAQIQSLLIFDYAMYTWVLGIFLSAVDTGLIVSRFDDGSAVTTSAGTSASSSASHPTSTSAASPSKSHIPTAIMVGSICGVLAFVLACALIWCRRRRIRRYRNVPQLEPDAFVADPPSYASSSIVEARDPTPSGAQTFSTALPPYTPQESTVSLLAGKR